MKRRADGRVVLIVGATGSGKTSYARATLRAAPRLLVWDVEHSLAGSLGCQAIASRRALLAALRAAPSSAARIAYQPAAASPDEFDFFAGAAFAWVGCAPAAILAEELADVTRPGKAPVEWGKLLRRGRVRGAMVYAITQRITECDTTVSGLAAELVCFRLDRPGDRARMAECMDVSAEEIGALRTTPRAAEFLRRDRRAGKLHKGSLPLPVR